MTDGSSCTIVADVPIEMPFGRAMDFRSLAKVPINRLAGRD